MPSRSVSFAEIKNLVPIGYFRLIDPEHSTFNAVFNPCPGTGLAGGASDDEP